MKYLPVFDIHIQHTYFANGRCADFSIFPTPETEQVMKNHRAMVRSLPDGVRVITSIEESGDALLAFPANQLFRFALKLDNSEFSLITNPDDIPVSSAPIYSNAALTGTDQKTLNLVEDQAWNEEKFQTGNPASNDSFVLTGKPLPGLTTADFELTTTGGEITLTDYTEQDKIITVNSLSASEGQVFSLKYPITPSLPRGVFAYIDIHVNSSLPDIAKPAVTPREFQINFQAKQATWAYYYLTDLENLDTAYEIIDSSPVEEGPALSFNATNRRDLNANPDPLDDKASELADRYPLLKRFRFLSDAPVTCRQSARKHLNLHINGNKMVGALPNPSYRNFSTGRVEVEGEIQKQDWLYEVVKILTNNGA